jgi:hypothetical protein
MFGNLLVKKLHGEVLDDFVADLSERLRCGPFQLRQSSNYLDERYFRAAVLGIAIKVAGADDVEFVDYHFWISLEPDDVCVDDTNFFDGLADCTARKLAILGYEVARPLSFDRSGGGAVLYRLNPNKNAGLYERVITQEV